MRKSKIELLRVISMLMIICLHYLSKGGALVDASAKWNTNGYLAWCVEAFCLVAVNVYVLISGYFSNVNSATYQKPWKLWLQVWFYSLLIGVIAYFIGAQSFDLYTFFTLLFPIVTEHYWFATSFVLLSVLAPFLQKGTEEMEQKTFGMLLVSLLLFCSIAKTVIPMQLPWDKLGYDVVWFLCPYLTGRYLRKFGLPKWLEKRSRSMLLYLCSVLIIFASALVLRQIYVRTGKVADFWNYGYTYNFFFCYTGAIGLFLFFLQGKEYAPKTAKWINTLAKATFGVYLLHEHLFLRYLWPKWFHCEDAMQETPILFLLHMFGTVLLVYVIGTIFELVRQYVWKWEKIAAVILLIYPLRHASVGIDLLDAGYALGNYKFLDTMNETWKIATYLANVLGNLLMKLPFGDRWVGMNVYTGLMLGLVAAGTFLYCSRKFPERKLLLFIAELAALSVCWAPTTILYHYLGYFMMTTAVIILYEALEREQIAYYVIAGVILGLSVMVRMPNITYAAFILPVWYGLCLKQKKKRIVRNTGWCITGYVIGILPVLGVICLRYGRNAYPDMIHALFSMTDTATDYKPVSMLTGMFGDYMQYSIWLLLFAAYMLIGAVLFRKLCSVRTSLLILSKIVYVVGLFAVLRVCYGRGMFGVDYQSFFAMYKWLTVYLLMTLLLSCYCMLSKKTKTTQKIWASFLLIMIMITPLGSNNALHPIINNLFLVAPVSVVLLLEVSQSWRKNFAVKSMLIFLGVCIVMQSFLFGMMYVFHDQADARRVVEISGVSTTQGMKTDIPKADALEELGDYLEQLQKMQTQESTAPKVLLYGDIPALSYIFDLDSAIYTTWIDLDSNTTARLQEDFAMADDSKIIVILSAKKQQELETAAQLTQKDLMIQAWMKEHDYKNTFQNELFYVYE